MTESCTCGTKLVENARFCHRCGRPTFEIEVIETPTAVVERVPTLQEKLAQLPVGFGNPIALRVAFLMSLAIMMVQIMMAGIVPVLNLVLPLFWVGAGWCTVLLYRRLTGAPLSVPAGARLGSITGVLAFISIVVLMSAGMFFTGKQILNQMVQQDARMKDVVNNPPMLAALFLLMLILVFAVVVGLCAAGGALGARFSRKAAN